MTTSTSSRGGDVSLPPGTIFSPTDGELTDSYLRYKIAGKDLPGATGRFIHVADIYSVEPEKLTEGFDEAPGKEPVWYFFSPVRYVGGRKRNARGGAGRKSRTIDGGKEAGEKRWWHSETGETPVKGGSEYGGYEQYFSYKVKNASTGKEERGGWIMTEYGLSPEHGGGELVLCKIHRSPNSKKRKAPAGAGGHYSEDSTPSAPPESDLTWMDDAAELHRDTMYGADGVTDNQAAPPSIPFQNMDHDDDMVWPELVTWVDVDGNIVPHDDEMYGAVPAVDAQEPVMMHGAAGFSFADQAVAPPSNFLQNVQQDFRSLYQSDMVMPVDVPSWAPAAQWEDDAATRLLQTISGYEEVPSHNCIDGGQPDQASFRDDEPDKTAADQANYGLPCPSFSPEMIQWCSNNVTMPWQFSSSVSMTSGLY